MSWQLGCMARPPMMLSRAQRHRQAKKVRIWFSGCRSMAGIEEESNAANVVSRPADGVSCPADEVACPDAAEPGPRKADNANDDVSCPANDVSVSRPANGVVSFTTFDVSMSRPANDVTVSCPTSVVSCPANDVSEPCPANGVSCPADEIACPIAEPGSRKADMTNDDVFSCPANEDAESNFFQKMLQANLKMEKATTPFKNNYVSCAEGACPADDFSVSRPANVFVSCIADGVVSYPANDVSVSCPAC